MTALRLLVLLAAALPGCACADALSDAFDQGANLGRAGSLAAKAGIAGTDASATVSHYTPAPPETAWFGGPGLGAPAAAALGACAAPPGPGGRFADQACNAVDFSQANPTRRPHYAIAPNDPLLTRAKAIAADPQAIAGNLAGTYSACSVQTVTQPDVFETQTCHQARTTQTLSCDKILIVTPTLTPGCTPGQFLARVTADPCPACVDYVAFDFSCGTNDYFMHVFTIEKATGALYWDLGSLFVPGTLNTEIPQTPGPTKIDATYCYQTHYSQSCSGTECTIGAWFRNPCQGTSFQGSRTFAMPTTVSFVDAWDNQCAALEARAR